MAKVHGKNAALKLDNGAGALQDLSTYLDTLDLPRDVDLADVTAFGDGAKKTVPGLKDAKIPISGPYDATLDAHMDGIYGLDATQTFEMGFEGSASGKPKYSGECRIENYTVRTTVSGRVEWSASLQVDGAVTRGTWA